MTKQEMKKVIPLHIYNFFRQDILDFKKYPDETIAKHFFRKTDTYSVLHLTTLKGTALYDEIKDIFTSILQNGEPYSYKTKGFPYLFLLPDYMVKKGYDSFSCIKNVNDENKQWAAYWHEKGKKDLKSLSRGISISWFILTEYRDSRTGLERNYWKVDTLKLCEERIDKSSSTCNTSFNFWNIQHEGNRECCKLFIKHLLSNTELAYSTIFNHYNRLSLFLNATDKPISDVVHEDIVNYMNTIPCKTANTQNHILNTLKSFFNYLGMKELYQRSCPVIAEDFVKEYPSYIRKAIPEVTFLELFRHIQKLPENFLLMFLIDAFTGIRISDICQLKTDCLYKNEYGYFIAHNIQKMQKVGSIPISKELYKLIEKRIAYIKNLDYEETYLFPSATKRNTPYLSLTYRNAMKRIIAEWNIKTPDGSDYHFTTHAFRHTISTELYNMGMPPALIQLGILHHAEIDMSRHYIELDEKTHQRIQREKLDTDKKINTQKAVTNDAVLPNGHCGMPAKIQCPHLNSCLECKFFRTSVEFLDIHQKQLEQLKEQLLYFEVMGYEHNVAITKKQIHILETIIESLETIKEEHHG